MTTAERIKKERKKAGLTQQQLAKRMGTTQQNIAQYESGTREPKLNTLNKIAASLSIPVDRLLYSYSINYDTGLNDQGMMVAESSALPYGASKQTVQEKDDIFSDNSVMQKSKYKAMGLSDDKITLLLNYNKLNNTGKDEARKRIRELAMLPEYTDSSDDPPENKSLC
ncbi:MAG: helix-turn-helix domain-containing protein [Lachnospiraceae bacterium]|nr:helix-turn-helix domain-containing protein [Lachnospiraceae bacterium]